MPQIKMDENGRQVGASTPRRGGPPHPASVITKPAAAPPSPAPAANQAPAGADNASN